MNILKKMEGLKLPLLGAIGLLFALNAVLSHRPEPRKEPVVSPPTSPYANHVAGIGLVEPKSEIINIGTELPGIVREVAVQVGDQVQAGDVLFALDQRDILTQIQILTAALEAAKAQSREAAAQFELVKDIADRRAVARDDYNHRKYNAEMTVARVDQTAAQLQQAITTQERLRIRAPIDGQILSVNVRLGEFAPTGMLDNPLIRMGDISTRHVRVEIDEENAIHITKEAEAIGYTRGNTTRPIPLQFIRFEPYIRPKQNLAVTGQRVDTHVLQVIYALAETDNPPYVGEQMDVYVARSEKALS